MITVSQVLDLADKHNLPLHSEWERSTNGRDFPKRLQMHLSMFKPMPEVWEFLMSDLSEVPVRIRGSRPGIHDTLHPEYVPLLPRINEKRAALNLEPVPN